MNREPTIYNVTLTSADTEYSQLLPQATVKALIRSREGNDIKLAYVEGESGINYITIPAGSGGKYIENIELFEKTLYMQSPDAGGNVEIEVWK